MIYQNYPDDTLVLLTLAGEQTAYEVLVARWQRAVIVSAASVTRSRFSAEDAAQDAFVTAWMKLNTLSEPKKYGAWVCRIAKNCARKTVIRYSGFLPLDDAEPMALSDNGADDPAALYELSEERDEVNRTVQGLSDRVREIIRLHYYENLSIAEIADRMRLSEGTVKWQLHEGRKQIRKELCAMNESYSDTLVQRVMKKVEELKLWQVKNDRSGFEKVYREILREVEELPECREKQHALADVLMRGWWWLPGKKNDALLARIADAAIAGKNEDVMAFLVQREDNRVYGGEKIDFIRNKQIPRLEKEGFVKTLGKEWFELGYQCFREGRPEEGKAAYDQAERILAPEDIYRILIPNARKLEETVAGRYREKPKEQYRVFSRAEEYRYLDGAPRFWKEEYYGEGYLAAVSWAGQNVFRNASACDGMFFADRKPGETYIGTDGTKLTCLSAEEQIETPAGTFDGCALWEVRRFTDERKTVCRTYYKEGIGIVRQDYTEDGVTETRLLRAYSVKDGTGLMPFAVGNTWEYALQAPADVMSSESSVTVAFADREKVVLAYWTDSVRLRYSETSWSDAVQEIANGYYRCYPDGREELCDVSDAIERAERLAVTPLQKAHTKAAVSTIHRILDGDPTFHPDGDFTGHWNFFAKQYVRQEKGRTTLTDYNGRWSFEWKMTADSTAAEPILSNDIFGILRDTTRALWSEEWRIGASPLIEYDYYDDSIRTQITCEDGGTVTTAAGTFENCFRLCLDSSGFDYGWSYRGGKKVYTFAEGIGIVRIESEVCGGAKTVVYELTAYEGVGEGYMPFRDGMVRRYDALDLTDGYVASAEYTCMSDGDGDLVLFSERIGVKKKLPPITQYSAIQSELIEDRLWDEGKHEQSRALHEANNFGLLCHFLGRPNRYYGAVEKAIAWHLYRLKILESLGGGEIPEAWLGFYAELSFRTACALFGNGRKEEGYEWLDKAFAAYPKWTAILDGAELSIGEPMIYGEGKVVKGKGILRLPDGSSEAVLYPWLFEVDCELMYYGMTASHGWEWFNPVRNEERFREYVERARIMKEEAAKKA